MTDVSNHDFRNGLQIIKGLLKQIEKKLKEMEKAYDDKLKENDSQD